MPVDRARAAGTAPTIIDGQGNGSVLYISGQAGPNTIIEGLTFTNGSNVNGGGMYIVQSSPTVIDCIFRDNEAHNGSCGGVYAQVTSASFINCTFENNVSTYWGGGMTISNLGAENPTLTGCTFRRNLSGTNGGGLVINNTSGTVSNCTFIANLATTRGLSPYLWRFFTKNLPRSRCFLAYLCRRTCSPNRLGSPSSHTRHA